jgi:hypothetical protein
MFQARLLRRPIWTMSLTGGLEEETVHELPSKANSLQSELEEESTDTQGSGRSEHRLRPPSPWKWTLALALASVILVVGKPYVTGKAQTEGFALTATDRNGRVELHWNAASPLVQSAQSAVLDVVDGGNIKQYKVDAKVLRSGALDYLRNGEDATVSLTLMRDGQPVAQGMIQSVGAIGGPPAVPAVSTRHRTTRRR